MDPKRTARTDAGREFARAVLEQTVRDEVTEHPNPVIRRLQQQARTGAGSAEGCLPPSLYTHLLDRLYGKVLDRVKFLAPASKEYEGMTDAELAARAEQLAVAIRGRNRAGDVAQ
jgi:hypothetical protein